MSHVIILFLVIIKACTNDEISESKSPKRSLDNIQRVQDLSQRIPAGVGYLPIEEIIRKTNLSNIKLVNVLKNESSEKPTTVKSKEPKKYEARVREKNQHATIKIIIKGSDAQVRKLPYYRIMKNMHLIDKVNLPMKRKMLVWSIIKAHKPIQNMRRSHLKKIRKLLYDIPESDLVHINVTDWNVIRYLGTSKILSRRQAGIIGYAMKHKWGKDIIEKLFFINKMKGLICGFSQTDLQKISPEVFTKIEESVFANVWACTQQQLKILLNIALKPHAHGPLEVWTNETVQKIGLLMTLLQPSDFKKLNSVAFKGLNYNIMEMMSTEQVNQFNQEQISYLDEQALMLLKEKIATINEDNGVVAMKALDLVVTLWIIFFMKSM